MYIFSYSSQNIKTAYLWTCTQFNIYIHMYACVLVYTNILSLCKCVNMYTSYSGEHNVFVQALKRITTINIHSTGVWVSNTYIIYSCFYTLKKKKNKQTKKLKKLTKSSYLYSFVFVLWKTVLLLIHLCVCVCQWLCFFHIFNLFVWHCSFVCMCVLCVFFGSHWAYLY